MAPGDEREGMERLDCEAVLELLPWYARGTLATDERRAVDAHLEGCASCRAELADVRRALWIVSRHLPAGLLADYAAGLELGDWPRELVEQHLAGCAECRDDLALDAFVAGAPGGVEAMPPAAPIPFRRAAAPASWRPWALAASLVAAVALGWFARAFDRPVVPGEEPRVARVALVELEPESSRSRGRGDETPSAEATTPIAVVLHSDLVADATDYRLRVLAPGGELLHQATGLGPDATGAFVVLLHAGSWPAGELRLELEAAAPDGWASYESYRLTLAR